MANLDEIELECPRCLHRNRVPAEQAGQRIDCSNCQGSLIVPAKNPTNDLFDDIFDSPSELPGSSETTHSDLAKPDGVQPDAPPEPEVQSSDPSDENLLEASATTTSNDDANPLKGKNPFDVDPDAPLKVDGLGDVFSHADVYGFKCNICDTRVHVRPDQVGSYVQCPECFTKLMVKPPEKPKPSQRWVKENHGRSIESPEQADDELKLSDPIERPKMEIDPSFGLAPPEEDLLAPKKTPPPTKDASADSSGNDPVAGQTAARKPRSAGSTPVAPANTPTVQPNRSTPAGVKSRRERYEESQRRQLAQEAGVTYRPANHDEFDDVSKFPDYEFGSLFGAAIGMLKSPGVLWRVLIAVGLMLIGALAMEWILPVANPPTAEGDERSLFSQMMVWAAWAFFGALPYLLGTLLLWLVCGYIFRDAALGRRQVESWKNAGVSEFSGTFLIFAFGFFIGGLPALFLIWLVMPLRVLLGPLFLLSAWYGQSPFSIVNVDAFKNVTKESANWQQFYVFMLFLAFLGLVAGIMFGLRALTSLPLPVTFFLTVLPVLIFSIVTLLFAAVCGWHCGRVAEGLEKSA